MLTAGANKVSDRNGPLERRLARRLPFELSVEGCGGRPCMEPF